MPAGELEGLQVLVARAGRGDVVAAMCYQDRVVLDAWLRESGATVDRPETLGEKALLPR